MHPNDTGAESDYTRERTSHISTNTTSTSSVYLTSSVTSSPRSAKRYSNNLFVSGRLQDYPYLRSISQKAEAIEVPSASHKPTPVRVFEKKHPSILQRVGAL